MVRAQYPRASRPRGSGIGSSKRRFQPRSAIRLNRLAEPLHREFDIIGLQMAPALNLGLVPILGEALEVFRRDLFSRDAQSGELLADVRIARHWPWSLFRRCLFALENARLIHHAREVRDRLSVDDRRLGLALLPGS
jgi:hypothetical protein